MGLIHQQLLCDELMGKARPIAIAQLVSEGADVNCPFSNGFTPLYVASTVYGDHANAVQTLLDKGAKCNVLSPEGLSCLYVAAQVGNTEVVKTLARAGESIHFNTRSGATPLYNAAEEGQTETVEALLCLGADPDARNNRGETPLDAARKMGHYATAAILEKYREQKHGGGTSTNLATSSLISFSDIAEAGISAAFCDSGDLADLDYSFFEQVTRAGLGSYGSRIKEEITPLLFAIACATDPSGSFCPSDREIVRVCSRVDGVRAFLLQFIKDYYLVKGICCSNEALVCEALDRGADPNRRCNYRRKLATPIVQAVLSGSLEVCRLLCEHGADVNLSQSNTETALANAVNVGNYEMTAFLLSQGADPNAMTYGGTALALADGVRVMELLVDYGADVNIPDKDGDLPIIGCIDMRRYEEVEFLRRAGTNLEFRNRRGETPLDHGRKTGDSRIMSALGR